MMDEDRVLRPLAEARPSIERLSTYESPAALQDALRATWHAVETSLRTLLRSDTAAADDVRLKALSSQDMPFETVLAELRRRERISLALAGRVHELSRAADRAAAGSVRAADADAAQDVVERLRAEVRALARTAAADAARYGPPGSAARPAVMEQAPAGERGVPTTRPRRDHGSRYLDDPDVEASGPDDDTYPDSGGRRRGIPPGLRRPVVLIAGALLLLAAIVVAVLVFGRTSEMDQGVTAFRAGRTGVAEQHFRAALRQDADNITARLYLGRILRDQQRYEEAANVLREAARQAPRDASVRRELGYLFMVLNRPQQAAAQFQQAVELEPEEPLGWVGLVQALQRAGDPSAEMWLSRAPATAQAMIRTGRR